MRIKPLITNLLLLVFVLLAFNWAQQEMRAWQDGQGILGNSFSLHRYQTRNFSVDDLNVALDSQAAQIANGVKPAVVSVYGVKQVTRRTAPQKLYLPLFKKTVILPADTITEPARIIAGSGFFISSDGYILTNRHVVSDKAASYSVQLSSGIKADAEVVYRDQAEDLAVLKIAGYNYPILPLGDSSQLKVGQKIMSMGNAFGQFTNTVSPGAVSALNRSIAAEDNGKVQKLNHVIQTSAQLYPGDSGGPTFDLNGSVVGVNVATAVTESNVSFSIPINQAKDVIQKALNQNNL